MESLQTFTQEVKDKVISYLPKGEYDLALETVKKVNRSYLGLKIARKGDKKELFVDLEDCYDKYCHDVPMDTILDGIKDVYLNMPYVEEPTWIEEYEKVKDKIFLKVHQGDPNDEKTQRYPHKSMSDLIMTYHILLQKDEEKEEILSAIVTNEMVKNWNVSIKKFEEDAMKSAMNMFPLMIIKFDDSFVDFQTRAFTNKSQLNGAAVLFYPGTIEKIIELCKGDFTLIPSSIHEVIVYGDQFFRPLKDVNKDIRDINAKYCNYGKDVLSDHCYRYECDYGELESSEDYLDRIRRKVKN